MLGSKKHRQQQSAKIFKHILLPQLFKKDVFLIYSHTKKLHIQMCNFFHFLLSFLLAHRVPLTTDYSLKMKTVTVQEPKEG